MSENRGKRKNMVKKSIFLGKDDAVSSEMGTEQPWQVLCLPLTVHLHAKLDAQISKYIIKRFCDRGVTVS